jgi:hypothetical protein
VEINMNQQCIVTLNKRGIEALESYFKNLQLEQPKKYEVGDKYKSALWDVMNIFGPYSFMGPVPPFETTFEILPL